jgi:uncharacterized protein
VNSCLYEGSVRHRRHGSPRDELHYRMFMVYLDLDELPQCLDVHPLWSARRPALAWFRRADHLGDPATPLAEAVRELVAERTGARPEGPIRLLTHLRYLGHCFNPVSFYYCFDATSHGQPERLGAVVAHVTNTPWGESHSYVLDAGPREAGGHDAGEGNGVARHSTSVLHGSSRKQLHVSPLMSMRHTYHWHASNPAERLSVHIESRDDSEQRVFDATLSLRRRELDRHELTRALVRYPLLTARIVARIYGHALSLRVRGAGYFPRPRTAEQGSST